MRAFAVPRPGVASSAATPAGAAPPRSAAHRLEIGDPIVEVADRADGSARSDEPTPERLESPDPGTPRRTSAARRGGDGSPRGTCAGHPVDPDRATPGSRVSIRSTWSHIALRPAIAERIASARIGPGAGPSAGRTGPTSARYLGSRRRGAGRRGPASRRSATPSAASTRSAGFASVIVTPRARASRRPGAAARPPRRARASWRSPSGPAARRCVPGTPRSVSMRSQRALGRQRPGAPVIGQQRREVLVEQALRLGVVDRHERLDPAVQVAVHQVAGADVATRAAPPFSKRQIRECSRNSPMIERTRIRSDSSRRPGRACTRRG